MITTAKIRLTCDLLLPIVFYGLPPQWIMNGHPVCLFRNLGLPCYGCGMTRALYSLLHGDLGAAWEYNSLVIVVAPLLLCLYFKELQNTIRTIFCLLPERE